MSRGQSLYDWCIENGGYGQQLLNEWVGLDENNIPIDINKVSYGSSKKVKWKCSQGHVWAATIANRTHGSGCPHCAGKKVTTKNSLKTWCEQNGAFGQRLLREWTGIDEKGNYIDINKVSYASTKRVYWKCSQGHKWIVRISSRTNRKSGCPHCYRERGIESVIKSIKHYEEINSIEYNNDMYGNDMNETYNRRMR